MARGVNKVILIGNLGNDPECKSMPNGNSVTNITVATSESWKDKHTGDQQERTEWHRVVFFNKLAEIAGQYLRKGSKVYLEGSLRTRKWQDQGGKDRYTTEIVSNEMQMLDSQSQGSSDAQQSIDEKYSSDAPSVAPQASVAKQSSVAQRPSVAKQASVAKKPSVAKQASYVEASGGMASSKKLSVAQSVAPPPVDEFDEDIPF